MNKLLIGLLIVAVGAAVLIYFNRKAGNKPTQDSLTKEWIIGKWKEDKQPGNDSNFITYNYHFLKDGKLLRSLNDATKADTLHYEWSKNNDLVWSEWTPSQKEKATDSTGKSYAVIKLTQDSLQMLSMDSVFILFIKTK